MSSANKKLAAEDWDKLGALFHEASPLQGEARSEFLRNVAREHSHLVDDLSSLLSAHDRDSGRLENPVGPALQVGSVASSRVALLSPGTVAGDFEILRLLGSGSLAQVYLARQRSLDRLVALKVSPGPNDEAKTLASVEHENIVRVFLQENDEKLGVWLLAMQYVAGPNWESLHKSLSVRGDIPPAGKEMFAVLDSLCPREAQFTPSALPNRERLVQLDADELLAELGSQLAQALHYAHTRGVLHLDIKPANLLMDSYGRSFLTDFNVAMRAKDGERRTPVGGTLKYMAPEQAKSLMSGGAGEVDERADLFSLGKVLLEWNPTDPRLRAFLERAATDRAADRWANAGELASALREWLAHRALEKALPKPWLIGRAAMRMPIVTLTVVGGIPQLIAAFLAVTYNATHIVGGLSAELQRRFWELLKVYLAVNSAWPLLLWMWLMVRLGREWESTAQAARKHVLHLPTWSAFITLGAWLPGALYFPLMLGRETPIGPSVYVHFLFSFALSSLVALAYSHALTQYICLRIIYPRFWSERLRVEGTAAAELKRFRRAAFRNPILSSTAPLLAACLLLAFDSPKVVILVLMGLSLTGSILSLTFVNRLGLTLSALSGEVDSRNTPPKKQ